MPKINSIPFSQVREQLFLDLDGPTSAEIADIMESLQSQLCDALEAGEIIEILPGLRLTTRYVDQGPEAGKKQVIEALPPIKPEQSEV